MPLNACGGELSDSTRRFMEPGVENMDDKRQERSAIDRIETLFLALAKIHCRTRTRNAQGRRRSVPTSRKGSCCLLPGLKHTNGGSRASSSGISGGGATIQRETLFPLDRYIRGKRDLLHGIFQRFPQGDRTF